MGIKDSDIELILGVLRRYPEVKEAIIFGLRAMGNYKSGSDVDLVLKGKIRAETVTTIAVELNECSPLPYKFDVVEYSFLDHKALIEQIDQYGKILYKYGKRGI